jgi:copper chaperone CopZ
MEPLTLTIDGMSCAHCLHAVRDALGRAAGVTVDSVQMGRAVVRFDPAVTTPARITDAVADAGYPAQAA